MPHVGYPIWTAKKDQQDGQELGMLGDVDVSLGKELSLGKRLCVGQCSQRRRPTLRAERRGLLWTSIRT